MSKYCCFKRPIKKYYIHEIKNPLAEIIQQLNTKFKEKNFNDLKNDIVKYIPPNVELRIV